MTILLLAAACVAYNGLYMYHCARTGNYRAVVGTGILIFAAAAGALLFGSTLR